MVVDIDVAVVGLGAMGSAALWRLAERGARAVGFEQFEPGHDRGSSHGEMRIIRTAYAEDPRYVPLIQQAFPLWQTLEQETGVTLLTMTGSLMIGHPDSGLLSGALASLRTHGLDHEVLTPQEMRRRYPQHQLGPDEMAVYEAKAGLLRPEAAVSAAVRRAQELGATVHQHTVVERVDMTPDGVTIDAAGQTYRARHAIMAAGAWLTSLCPALHLPLQVERQVQVWFAVRDPALFTPERCPVYIREVEGGGHRYGFPSLDGATIKIGIHHEGAMTTADTLDREVHAEDLRLVEEFVHERLVGVEPEAVRGMVCMYTNTPDRHFIVGPPPGLPAVTLLSACSGHGFKFAAVLGDAAADLALEGRTRYPIELFSPLRFVPA